MPFSLAYGMEVIILVDISMPILRVEGVDRDQNDAQLFLILNQSEEKRQQAQIHHSIPTADLSNAPQEVEDANSKLEIWS